MFVKNCWYVAGWEHELIDGALLGRTILGERVLFYKDSNNKVIAMDDRCCHRGAALSLGRLEGDNLRCMYHGLLFDSEGTCIEVPGRDAVPPSFKVPVYPVEVRDKLIWIWMGVAELANRDEIPGFEYLSKPEWHGEPGYLHYEANYQLLVDNLADFNHMAYVHANTFCGPANANYVAEHAESPVERLDNGFRVTKYHMNSELAPFVKKFVPDMKKVDRWNTVRMQVPGYFYLESGFSPAGNGIEKGNREGSISFRNLQAMTPETENTTHLFWVYMHDQTENQDLITRSLTGSIVEGLYEDMPIIELQQQILEKDPGFSLKSLPSDVGLNHMRWLLAQQIKKEQGSAPQRDKEQARKESVRAGIVAGA